MKNKRIVLSKHVTFDETSLLKSTVSQQVERTKSKDVSHRVEVDATLPSPVDSVSMRTFTGCVIELRSYSHFWCWTGWRHWWECWIICSYRTKIKSRKWVKKYESQVGPRQVEGHCSPWWSWGGSYDLVKSVHCWRFSYKCMSLMELISMNCDRLGPLGKVRRQP